jgi:hypothetical protein
MSSVRGHVWVLALVGVLSHASELAAQAAPVVSREYRLKARVLEILGQSVTWPAESAPTADKPLTIGILGRDTFFENGVNQLDAAVAAAKAKGTRLTVHRFPSASDYRPCHILFISGQAAPQSAEKSVAERLRAAVEAVGGKPVLIVGETPGLATQGAIANLVFNRATNLIRLEINPDAASRASLKLAPDLMRLNLVEIVRDPPG